MQSVWTNLIVGHIYIRKTHNFTKTIFYFIRVDKCSICEIRITGKPFNLGDGEGMQIPCKLKLTGRSKFVKILRNFLKTLYRILLHAFL